MTPELTDADRAALIDAVKASVYADARDLYDAIYLAGKLSGRAEAIADAARVCENHTCGSSYPLHLEGQVTACKACAAAIRAMESK